MAPYVQIAAATVGAVILAWIADLVTGRRGLAATLLVAAVGALCGGFLAIRVFAVTTLSDWLWTPWSLAAAVFCLIAYFLFRNKR